MENQTKSFKAGDYVVYGTNGVCLIEDVSVTSLSSYLPAQPYYILRQITKGSTIYVPLSNELLLSRMRYVLTGDEINALLLEARGKEIEWDDDRKARALNFRDILNHGIHEDMILMMRCIYSQRCECIRSKKKLSGSDSDILQTAEQVVEEEFAFSLGIPKAEVGDYIRSVLDDTPEKQSFPADDNM